MRKDQLKRRRRGQEEQEFSDCIVRTPNSKIEAYPQLLTGLPLHYTCLNWVRELEL